MEVASKAAIAGMLALFAGGEPPLSFGNDLFGGRCRRKGFVCCILINKQSSMACRR
jgi:hypothetical protein